MKTPRQKKKRRVKSSQKEEYDNIKAKRPHHPDVRILFTNLVVDTSIEENCTSQTIISNFETNTNIEKTTKTDVEQNREKNLLQDIRNTINLNMKKGYSIVLHKKSKCNYKF